MMYKKYLNYWGKFRYRLNVFLLWLFIILVFGLFINLFYKIFWLPKFEVIGFVTAFLLIVLRNKINTIIDKHQREESLEKMAKVGDAENTEKNG